MVNASDSFESQPSKTEQTCSVSKSDWFVYLLRCADNSLYCGITTNLQKRLRQHNGELTGGAKYTKTRQPCELVYSESAEDRSSASKREYEIKQLSKTAKEKLF
ncbi:MAG: GIY-YIG nuclease family protein [Pseudomonadota bacterium]|nr:GIY-YIG nuclease family protein [Pseudomonadota bacterium]